MKSKFIQIRAPLENPSVQQALQSLSIFQTFEGTNYILHLFVAQPGFLAKREELCSLGMLWKNILEMLVPKKKKCWSLCRWTKETGQARARAWVWVNVPQHAGKEDLESFATLVESGRMAKILAATPGRQCCWSLCHGAILSSGRDSSVICRTQCRMEVWGPCSKSRKKWGAWVAQGVKKQEEVTF